MTLPRATTIVDPGFTAADAVRLDYDDRFRRRKRYTAEGGLEFLLDLPDATVLRDGQGLRLEDGRVVLVKAADEPLIEVRAESQGALVKLAWHLGNRHLPAELHPDRILIRQDHVIEHMLIGLGAALAKVSAPFNPEGGAYGEHNRSAHQHHHGHGHHHHHDGHGHHHHDH
ncbi:MAG: urease accessory protein UreE [Acetobacteraceae bacterium]|nr:urease accessory protein UreE [Acetobacteraceae bacterium]